MKFHSCFAVAANTTVEEPVKLDNEDKSRTKREVHEDDDDEVANDPEEKCRVDMWRCLSRVIEGGLHYIDHPEGIYRYDHGLKHDEMMAIGNKPVRCDGSLRKKRF